MKMNLILGFGCVLFSANLFAACPTVKDTIFACTMASGKVVSVCDSNNGSVVYSFGRQGQTPDKVLTRPYDKVELIAGKGGSSIIFADGNTSYTPEWSYNNQGKVNAGGILVEVNDKTAAELKCSNKSPIVTEGDHFYKVKLAN